MFFEFTENDDKTNNFFKSIIFAEPDKIKARDTHTAIENPNEISYSTLSVGPRVLECKIIILIVGYVEGAGGEQYPVESRETICKFVDRSVHQDTCIGIVDEFGNCGGGINGGDSGGGYNYPNPEEEEVSEDCAKIEQIGKNTKTKSLMGDLKTKSTQQNPNGQYRESSYSLTENSDLSITEQEFVGNYGENEIKLSINNPVDGYIHNHNPGSKVFTVFSPYDLASISLFFKNR